MSKKTGKNEKTFRNKKLVEYLAIPPRDKKCSCACTHCYLLHSPTMENAIERSEQRIIDDIHSLTEEGYKVFFCTTELFYYDRWREIFRIAGYKSIRSNGYPFVANPELAGKIKEMGVKKITFTANSGRYHEGLNLPKEKVIDKAIDLVNESGLVTSVNILLTKKNNSSLEDMVKPYMDRGVTYFIFTRVLPSTGITSLIMDTEDTKQIFDQVDKLKRKYPYNETGIYFEVSGEMGSTYRPNREKSNFYCPAGARLLAIGLDDGIYPCSFMTQKRYKLGFLKDGKIYLTKKFNLKLKNPLECLAYEVQKIKTE